MKSVSDVFLGSKLGRKFVDFGTELEPSEDDTLLEILKCVQSIFEQQSMHFDGIWSSRALVNAGLWK